MKKLTPNDLFLGCMRRGGPSSYLKSKRPEVNMKKIVVLLLMSCVVAALSAADQRPGTGDTAERRFRIDGIQEVKIDPCRARLLVKYYIDPAVSQPCFIEAFIPDGVERSGFEIKAAGGRRGVSKGEQPFNEQVAVHLHFLGSKPLESARVKVTIRDASGPLYSKSFPWNRLWARFAIQGIRPIQVTPDFARILVRYFIDPSYPDACYISGFVHAGDGGSNDFYNVPAGVNPTGVAKGQKNFGDNVYFDLIYKGAVTYRSSMMDMIIYRGPQQNLLTVPFQWEKAWRSPSKR